MIRKILIFALILQCLAVSSLAFSQIPSRSETSRLDPNQQLALDLFKDGKAAHDGINTPQDFEKARILYLEAAEFGSTQALINLGYLYFTGQGVESDFVKAREFYEMAARRGSNDAKENLKMMDARGLGVLPAAKPDAPVKWQNRAPVVTSTKTPVVVKAPAPTPTTSAQAAPSIDVTKLPQPQTVSIEPVSIGTVGIGPILGMPGFVESDLTAQIAETEPTIGNNNVAQLSVPRQLEMNPTAMSQWPSLKMDRSDQIAALLIGLGAFLVLIQFLITRKHTQNRKIREQFVHFFYEAKRSDLRLTYLRRQNEGFVEASFYKEWHATLTVLMARYALNFDEPDETLRVFCKKLNDGLSLHLRPTQHLASEFSDEMMLAARSEIKAVDAFHMANITEEIVPLSAKNAANPRNSNSIRNVVNLFQRNSG